MDNEISKKESLVISELYFLISKFLTAGPLTETAKVLVRELEEKKVLPTRLDWLGVEHEQPFAELEGKYSHINGDHLVRICSRIAPMLEKELPASVSGLVSLLGRGRQSLLRTKETIYKPRTLLDYCSRLHGVSLPDSTVTKPIHNIQKVLFGREYGGYIRRKLIIPPNLYSKTRLLKRTVGHLSSVYCVLFDRTGRYIITGADDLLIKIWSAMDGRLLATLRGASAEITDIAINLDNTMLAAGSLDRILRVWDLQTTSPIAVLTAHTGMITSVNFCPSPRGSLKYLVTTSTDGSIAFWQYSTPRGGKPTFAPKPIQYHEKLRPGQAQMMCTSFSPGGMFLAAGSADHHTRVYIMADDGPRRILETEAYTDAVDSVQWCHRGLHFISGSKDGTAHIWTFESQQWKSMKLCMTERLPSCPEPEEGKKLKVTMVAWDCSDKYVITAVNDFTIKIWHAKTGKLHCVLRGHKDELYVLESNPRDEFVLLSAGHDGQIFLWDIDAGSVIAHFANHIDGQGHGGVFDAKWSPDGTMIAATDSHGQILILGLGIGTERYKNIPKELFFHTDYRPLLRDAQHYVLDEQTQLMPHLMPPPFLVDVDGNPHPPALQKLVPGRENCTTEQLVPNLTVGAEGVVIDDSYPNFNPNTPPNSHIDRMIAVLANRQNNSNQERVENISNHSHLDRLIEALANRQGQDLAPDSNNRSANRSNIRRGSETGHVLGSGSVGGGGGGGSRSGSVVNFSNNDAGSSLFGRLSNGNRLGGASVDGENLRRNSASWQREPSFKYNRRIYVRPMKYSQLQNLKQTVFSAGQYEMELYKRETRRRPIMINTSNANSALQTSGRQRGARNIRRFPRNANHNVSAIAYRTRALRGHEVPAPPEDEEEDDVSSNSSGDTSYSNVEDNLDESTSTSDSESSDYSDWVADKPGPNLEPPKRSKRKPLSRHRSSSHSSYETSQPNTSTAAAMAPSSGSKSRRKKVQIPPHNSTGEIPEVYRPAEWLSEVIPRKTPYYPQMGDEVVYFRQGHHRYLEAVRTKKVYKLTHSSEPWSFRELRDHELVRVIGIKYEIRPPRLCCLKLAMIDEDGNMTGVSFKIKYHDMPDVLDFLVLRQTFDLAVQRNWSIGDRFRCMIGDGWWIGQIESRHILSPEFPNSYFMCFRVRWDNGEYEYMSPWDMEPIDANRLPDESGGSVPVMPEEIRATLYQPKSEEWHRGDRDGSCRRIINGLEQVMRLSIAEHFLAPVDLNIYPDYAYLIEYPIDLTTIKSRFENHFYRRITSAQFDVRYLATNAEQYNRSHTNIVKHARIITDLCLRIMREPNEIDVAAVYHQLVDIYRSSDSENENDTEHGPSTSTALSTSAAAAAATASAASSRKNISSTRRSNRIRSDGDWRSDCRQLLDMMWLRPDSAPFREPVDTIMFPDYLQIIDTPMDLRTVKEDLLGGNYEDPIDFAKDVRLIFQNSKNYNTNKRSRIYSMTLRLSALFESHMKTVISNWKAARRRANKNVGNSNSKRTISERHKSRSSKRQPIKSSNNGRNGNEDGMNTSEDDDNDDDDEEYPHHEEGVKINQRRTTTINNGNAIHQRSSNRIRNCNARTATSSTNNRVTSSSSYQTELPGPTVSSRNLRRNASSRPNSQEMDNNNYDDDDDDDDEDNDEDEFSSGNSSSTTSDDSTNITDSHTDTESMDYLDTNAGPSNLQRRKQRKTKSGKDSEDSYKPNDRGLARKRRKTSKKKTHRPPKRARHLTSELDEENDCYNNSNTHNRRNYKKTQNRRRHNSFDVDEEAEVEDEDSRRSSRRRLLPVQDESTQDASTPKKKGRPPKNGDDMPGTSGISKMQQQLQDSPLRGSRQLASRRSVAETDHSYHLPLRNGRIAESDTEQETVRPTRSSARRALIEWARGSNDEEDDDDEAEEILPTNRSSASNRSAINCHENGSEVAIGQTKSRTGTSTSGTMASMRQLRTNRNANVEFHESNHDDDEDDEEDDGSDNAPLASSQNSKHIYKKRNSANLTRDIIESSTSSPVVNTSRRMRNVSNVHHLQRRSAYVSNITSSHHMTRSNTATLNNDAVPSSSSSIATTEAYPSTNSTITSNPTQAEHNYMTEAAGPSIRNVRRVLSRHQRNADELDIDPLDSSTIFVESVASRLRRNNVATSSTNSTELLVRRGRSRYSQENSAEPIEEENRNDDNDDEDDNDDDSDEDNDDDDDGGGDAGGSDEGTDGGSNNNSTEQNKNDDDDVSEDDSEDNQPLKSYVSTRNLRRSGGTTSKVQANSASSSSRNVRKHLQRKQQHRTLRSGKDDNNHHSEDYEIDDDDDAADDDYEVHRSRRKDVNNRRSDIQNNGSNYRHNRKHRLRGSRNQKRPRYNEESDEEVTDLHYNSKRSRTVAATAAPPSPAPPPPTTTTTTTATTTPTTTLTRTAAATTTSASNVAANGGNTITTTAISVAAEQSNIENSDNDSEDDSNNERVVSVSSRGRVRKITAKARGLFKE